MIPLKTCPKCNKKQHTTHFYKRKTGFTHSWCKQCERNYSNNYKRTHEKKDISVLNSYSCPLCGDITYIGEGHPKGICRRCYGIIRYYKKREAILESSRISSKKRNPQHYKKYMEKHPEQKEKNKIRQATYHKYGKATICSTCGSKVRVHHHHILPYHVDHFIDLCNPCHAKIHRKEFPEKLKKAILGIEAEEKT